MEAIPTLQQADIARDLLPKLLGRMNAYVIPEFLVDIGTMANYRYAQDSWPGLDYESGRTGSMIC